MESILLVQTLFGRRQLFISELCKNTLREVPSYRAKKDVVGEEPLREKEDTCACLRYACWPEMAHQLTFKRYDSNYTVGDDILDHEPTDFDN